MNAPDASPDEPEDDGIGIRPFLGPAGGVAAIGPEKTDSAVRIEGGCTIATMRSRHGSIRYVASIDGTPVSMLQVVSRDGVHASIANVFTERPHRRRGIARMLLGIARTDFESVVHSDMLSYAGRAFAQATG